MLEVKSQSHQSNTLVGMFCNGRRELSCWGLMKEGDAALNSVPVVLEEPASVQIPVLSGLR